MKLAASLCTAPILLAAAWFAGAPASAQAQAWKPERPVEIIVGCAPGCGPDNMARVMQRAFQTHRYLDMPVNIQNKGGGMGAVLRTYLKQFEGNGHYLYHGDQGVLAAQAMGRGAYSDFTPVAILFGEYIGVAVKADSPIKSGRDLIERLQKNPAAASFGIATSLGNINHQGVAAALKIAGIDIRKTRNVIFDSGGLAITALLGGHIDAVPVSVGLWVPHLKTGAVRVIAVTAPERLPDFFAGIPTWREQGANAVVFNWRAIFGAKGMTAAQVAYWENVFQRLTDTQEWKAEITLRGGITQFTGAAVMKKRMDDEYGEIRALLMDLDLAKKSP
jgi:putative tricarboxylic transport membrane protein